MACPGDQSRPHRRGAGWHVLFLSPVTGPSGPKAGPECGGGRDVRAASGGLGLGQQCLPSRAAPWCIQAGNPSSAARVGLGLGGLTCHLLLKFEIISKSKYFL